MSSDDRPFLDHEGSANDDDSFDLGSEFNTYTGNGLLQKLGQIPAAVANFRSSVPVFWVQKILPNIGLVFVVMSQFFNSLMVVSTKLLETDPMFEVPIHPLQILFVRMGITLSGCYAYLKYVRREEEIFGPRELRWLLVARGIVGFVGVFGMYYSLMYLSVSDAVVITFLVPSVTGFLAWVILKERWTLIEAGGALVSLIGVLLIARPSFLFGESKSNANKSVETSNPEERLLATMVGLCGVMGASGVYIVIRKIGKRVHSLVTVMYFAMSCCAISLAGIVVIPGLSFQIPHTERQWFLFITLGVSGFFMQFLLTEGIQREKASRASAMLYTQMIYAIFWEVIVWNHLPNIWSWLGIVIIIGSAFYVIYCKPAEIKLRDPESNADNTQPDAVSLHTVR